ncbi:O-antigen ligase family protein, partial [Candidatus Kaiserbacteria bacterium]|nr:O-antigen ligase family protein [Candidatus Kaiserbacteria bacterium]
LMQLAGIASLSPGFSSASRIDASFGNPIYLAVYMLFNIGIAAALWSRAWQEYPRSRVSVALLYGGVMALDTLVLLLTGTRGAMVGLIGGIVLFLLITALHPDTLARSRRLVIGVLIGLFLVAGGLYLARDQAWVKSVPFLERLVTVSLEDNTTKARFMNWGMAWEGVKERPILGWGQENYAIVFDKYYNPQMYGQEQWFDRVHNIIFDWLVAAGFVGLISYLSLFGFALWYLWKGTTFNQYERSIFTGLLAAYFAANLTVFDNISSYLLFTIVLAYIAWRASQNSAPLPLPQLSQKLLPVAVIGAVALAWGSAWYVNARPLAVNRALIQAIQPQSDGIAKNLEYFNKSLSYGTVGTQEAREQLIQAAAQVIRIEDIPLPIKQQFLNTAAEEMLQQAEESPLDARFPLFLGALLNTAGNLEDAAFWLERAHLLSPGKQTILFEVAANALQRGDANAALAAYRQAFDLAPEFLDARLYYAAAVIRAGNDALARELLAPITESGAAADPRIAAAYVLRKRYDKVIEIWEARVKATPTETQPYFTLAAAYYGAGNSARAISVLEAVSEAIPSAKAQADALIGQIRSGTAKIQ